MSGAIPPFPQYAFMAWCSVIEKHGDNFTFYLISKWWGKGDRKGTLPVASDHEVSLRDSALSELEDAMSEVQPVYLIV
jgi:hypothetical protein